MQNAIGFREDYTVSNNTKHKHSESKVQQAALQQKSNLKVTADL